MLGWMDDEALHRTLTTGRVTYYSRSRGDYWRKGDSRGTCSGCAKFAWTVTRTRCWSRWIRSGRLATPVPAPCFDDNGLQWW